MDIRGYAFPSRWKTANIANLFWNTRFQRNADLMECGGFPNAPSFPRKR